MEAGAGLARAEAEVKARDAEADESRRAAEAGKVLAESDLAKSRLAQNVLHRFTALAPVLRKMEAALYDSTHTLADTERAGDALWPEVVEFMRQTPDDPASQATMKALAGWARRLAGRAAEGVAWMREAERLEPDLPFGPLIGAFGALAHHLEAQRIAGGK